MKSKEETALKVNKFIHEQCVDGVPHDIGWNVVEIIEEEYRTQSMKSKKEILEDKIIGVCCDETEYEHGSFQHYKEEVLEAMEAYRNQPSPDVHDNNVVNIPGPDKEELMDLFFKECVDHFEGQLPKVNIMPNNVFNWFWNNMQSVTLVEQIADLENSGMFNKINLDPVIDGDDVRLNWTTQTNKRGLDYVTSSASYGDYFCEIRHDSEPSMTKKGPVYQDEIAAHYWLIIKFRGVKVVDKHAAKLESLQEFCPKWLKQEVSEYAKKHLSNLPQMGQKDGWVSVADRMPDNGERVLVSSIYGVQIGWLMNTGTWEFSNGGSQLSLQFWQPLPELPQPPKE